MIKLHIALLLVLAATVSASTFEAGLLASASVIRADGTVITTDDEHNINAYEQESFASSEASYTVSAPRSMQQDLASGSDMGEPQVLGDENSAEIMAIIEAARAYLQDTVDADPKLVKIKSICENKHAQCAFWASVGECEVRWTCRCTISLPCFALPLIFLRLILVI